MIGRRRGNAAGATLGLALSLATSVCSLRAADLRMVVAPGEYAVWRAVITEFRQKEWPHERFRRIVVLGHTCVLDSSRDSVRKVTKEWDISDGVIEGFLEANKQSYRLENRFKLSIGINILKEEQQEYFFVKHKLDFAGWDLFYSAYPDSQGLMCLSRATFFEDGGLALVFASNQRHWLGGAGYLILLKREGSEWKVERRTAIWIS